MSLDCQLAPTFDLMNTSVLRKWERSDIGDRVQRFTLLSLEEL